MKRDEWEGRAKSAEAVRMLPAVLLSLVCWINLAACSHTADIRDRIAADAADTATSATLPPDKATPDRLALARDLIRKKFYDVALVQLRKAEEQQPDRSADIMTLTGVCHRETGKYEKARTCFEQALKRNPEDASAFNGLGLTLAMTGDHPGGLEAFRRAVALNPARADFYNNFGFLLMKTGRYEEAAHYLRQGLNLAPGDLRTRNNLAVCLTLAGDAGTARSVLEESGSPAAAWNNMGAALILAGDRRQAVRMFEKALKVVPSFNAARKNLRQAREENKDEKDTLAPEAGL